MRRIAMAAIVALLVAGCGSTETQPAPSSTGAPFIPSWLDYIKHDKPPPGTSPCKPKTWQDMMLPCETP